MNRRIFSFIFAVVLLGVGGLYAKNSYNKYQEEQNKITQSDGLQKVVSNILSGDLNNYGVFIKNLKTKERYSLNGNKKFETASLYKLWVMATSFQKIQNGSLRKDDVLSGDVASLNSEFDLDSDVADLSDGTISLQVSDSLSQMITISHNYAALLLTKRVALSSISSFLKDNNFKESSLGGDDSQPTSTASDIALFFEKLYSGKLVDQQYSNEMLDLLKKQQLNNKLPKNLPKDIKIAHKTGELDGLSHDGGIIYSPNGDYIIVIMSKTKNPSDAEDKIAELSKRIYDYFQIE